MYPVRRIRPTRRAGDPRGRRSPRLARPDRSRASEASTATPPTATAFRAIGAILGNVTLLTALLFWFGFLYSNVFFGYFRVHLTVLDQSTTDILARGVDGLFQPLAALAFATLLALIVVRYLRVRLRERAWRAVLRYSTPIAAATGLVLIVSAGFIALDPAPFRQYLGLPGLGWAIGVLLVFFAWRQRIGRPGAAETGIVVLLVVIGLFWSVSDYSTAVGTQRAAEVEASVPELPNLLLYSEKSLNLTAEGVHQSTCHQTDATYRYRYDGLKLLLRSGGQYILVPANWTWARGTTIVLPKTDSLRLEFTRPGTPGSAC